MLVLACTAGLSAQSVDSDASAKLKQFEQNLANAMKARGGGAGSSLQQQKPQLGVQLQNNTANPEPYSNSLGEGQVTLGSAAPVRKETLNQLNQRIATLQSEIAALQRQLTPNHPTVKRAQMSLAALQKAVAIAAPNGVCAIPLVKAAPDVAFKSNMPLIAPESNVDYAMRQVTPPAPSCDEQAKK